MNKDSTVSQSVQDGFVYLAITNTKFLQASRKSIKPQYFSSQVTEDLLTLCYSYFDQFAKAPDQHFHDELVRFLQDKEEDKKQLYVDYLLKLEKLETPNEAYIISRINAFVLSREFEKAAIKFIELAKKGEYEEAKQIMTSAIRTGIAKEDVGLRYLDGQTPTYYESEAGNNEYLMGTGFQTLDRRMPRGLRRTDFLLVLGGDKGKKSWACVHFGKEALIHGLKVLHITHELSLEETEMRYDRMLGGLVSYNKEPVTIEKIDNDGNLITKERIQADSVFDQQKVSQARKRAARFGGELIIKKYPMGYCTMDETIRYLDYLEAYEGFIPDLLMVDYIEKMRLPQKMERRDAINDYYILLKGIADERKLLAITVSQVTRDALQKKTLGQKDPAEDIRKMGNADLILGISQTKTQSIENRMQLTVMANRHGIQDIGCVFASNLDIGQLCVKDWEIKHNIGEEEE
jgi:hypothetical protein